jgi:predicted DNA-binding transcriptional regulator YafY
MTITRSSLSRIYELDRMIRLGKLHSAEQAARDHDVTRRTVERDLQELRALGAELRFNRGRRCYEYAGKPITLPAQWLTEQEIALILIAERALRVFTNTSFGDEVHPAFNKLLDPIRHDKRTIEYILALCNSVHFHRPIEPSRDMRGEFSVVLKAIMDRRRLSMLYRSARGGPEERREVEPYALVNNGGDWYLIGLCRRNHEVRTFALAEMREVQEEQHYFLMPDTFSVAEYLGEGFGRMHGVKPQSVGLRISLPAARWVARSRWHASQKVVETADGSITLSMRCPVTESLVRWVLQMGGCVRVLRPRQLREQVVAMAREIVAKNG